MASNAREYNNKQYQRAHDKYLKARVLVERGQGIESAAKACGLSGSTYRTHAKNDDGIFHVPRDITATTQPQDLDRKTMLNLIRVTKDLLSSVERML